jgi:predicted nucleic acid-binding protein
VIILIDTDVLVDHLRDKQDATNFLIETIKSGVGLSFSVITRIELFSGIRESEKKAIDSLLSSMQSIPVTDEIAEISGEYLRAFRKSHSLTIPDAIIAASAKYKKIALVTLNIKHFPMKDIEVIRPY